MAGLYFFLFLLIVLGFGLIYIFEKEDIDKFFKNLGNN
jgi:hypothetical protein